MLYTGFVFSLFCLSICICFVWFAFRIEEGWNTVSFFLCVCNQRFKLCIIFDSLASNFAFLFFFSLNWVVFDIHTRDIHKWWWWVLVSFKGRLIWWFLQKCDPIERQGTLTFLSANCDKISFTRGPSKWHSNFSERHCAGPLSDNLSPPVKNKNVILLSEISVITKERNSPSTTTRIAPSLLLKSVLK